MTDGETLINIDVLFGHVELEQRYVHLGLGTYECQGRSKHFDREGRLTETTEWEPLSRIANVTPEVAAIAFRIRG
jgi:hypothetical protein